LHGVGKTLLALGTPQPRQASSQPVAMNGLAASGANARGVMLDLSSRDGSVDTIDVSIAGPVTSAGTAARALELQTAAVTLRQQLDITVDGGVQAQGLRAGGVQLRSEAGTDTRSTTVSIRDSMQALGQRAYAVLLDTEAAGVVGQVTAEIGGALQAMGTYAKGLVVDSRGGSIDGTTITVGAASPAVARASASSAKTLAGSLLASGFGAEALRVDLESREGRVGALAVNVAGGVVARGVAARGTSLTRRAATDLGPARVQVAGGLLSEGVDAVALAVDDRAGKRLRRELVDPVTFMSPSVQGSASGNDATDLRSRPPVVRGLVRRNVSAATVAPVPVAVSPVETSVALTGDLVVGARWALISLLLPPVILS